jgi:hypothetical protein
VSRFISGKIYGSLRGLRVTQQATLPACISTILTLNATVKLTQNRIHWAFGRKILLGVMHMKVLSTIKVQHLNLSCVQSAHDGYDVALVRFVRKVPVREKEHTGFVLTMILTIRITIRKPCMYAFL